jgi:hypothetical protein
MAPANEDLPIALRRARRTSANRATTATGFPNAPPAPAAHRVHPHYHHHRAATPAASPSVAFRSTRKSSKRVRFSDPFPQTASVSTGLTPMVRRAGLASSASNRRRHSAPNDPAAAAATDDHDGDDEKEGSLPAHYPACGDVNFLPLRQVLDGRIQRRIRRNGLSEELSRASQDRRRRREELSKELEKLRADIKTRDAELYELRNATIVVDSERIWDLEAQVETLSRQLADEKKRAATMGSSPLAKAAQAAQASLQSPVSLRDLRDSPGARMVRVGEWTRLARDPFAPVEYDSIDAFMEDDQVTIATELNTDNGLDDDSDGFGDTTMTDIMCGTPTRPPRPTTKVSFPTPPMTSPSASRSHSASASASASASVPAILFPPTPSTPRQYLQPRAANMASAAVQTSFGEKERQSMRHEIESLQLELRKLTSTLQSYTSLTDRLSSRITASVPATTADATTALPGSQDIEQQLDSLLRLLGDRTAAVLHLTSALSELGFPGTEASEIVVSLASGFRAARLELEYLTPGEITLPLTSHGAEILDLLLSRLRELGRRATEDEATINEYHSLELSLRQQLSARVEAMDTLGAELARAQILLDEKSGRVQELELSVERLKGSVSGYMRDISELEELVLRLEKETREALETQEVMEEAHKRRTADKDHKIQVLEVQLRAARELACSLDAQLIDANARNEGALAERDARIVELSRDLDRISSLLRSSHSATGRLRQENGFLKTRVQEERRRGRGIVESMREEMDRVLSQGREMLATPKKGQPLALSEDDDEDEEEDDDDYVQTEPPNSPTPAVVVRPRSFGRGQARYGKPRQRLDSGLGLLDDEEAEVARDA